MESIEPQSVEQGANPARRRVERARFNPAKSLETLRDIDPDVAAGLSAEERRDIRRGRLEKFKENLEKRRQGLALAETTMRQAIEANPRIGKMELVAAVFPTLSAFGASEEDRKNFIDIINKYTANDKTVAKYREQYPDDNELFKACFGAYPYSRIDIIRQPGGIHIICYDKRDFSLCSNIRKARKDDGSVDVTKARSFDTSNIAGRALNDKTDSLISEMGSLITTENVGAVSERIEEGIARISRESTDGEIALVTDN
ncbi:MAG: hypothetical protein WC797_02830, partial [Candidatus Paceibacterota bacterium]